MIDSDLAALYGVETKVFNQAIRRNIDRFPEDFMFRLTREETENLRSQTVTSSWGDQEVTRSRALSTAFGGAYAPGSVSIVLRDQNVETPDLRSSTTNK
jgi:hypothetical protein